MAVDLSKLKPLIPAMTAATAPGILITDTAHYASNEGWKAFDRTTSNWDTQPANKATVTARFSNAAIINNAKYIHIVTQYVTWMVVYINGVQFDARFLPGGTALTEIIVPLNTFADKPITKLDVYIETDGIYNGMQYGYVKTIQLYANAEVSLFEMNKGLYTIANNAITQIRSDTDPTVSSFANGIALSDLTKPITVEGKPSTPLQEIGKTTDKIKIYTLVPPK